MFYHFKCKNGHTREYCISIKLGPPINVTCDCKEPMYQELGGNFILKGSFPGKDLKKQSFKNGKAKEETEEMILQRNSLQKNANEVYKERKKGKKSFKDFKTNNPGKMKDYKKAINLGIRGK